MKIKAKSIYAMTFFFIMVLSCIIFAEHAQIYAELESVRKDGIAVIVSQEKLSETEYSLMVGDNSAGQIKLISQISSSPAIDKKRKKNYKYLIDTNNIKHKNLITAGAKVALVRYDFIEKKSFEYKDKKDFKIYKNEIITTPLDTVMVFVKAGNCFIGSNDDHNDEYPLHMVYIDDFYIDKYEVSNRQFLAYIKETGSTPPASWEGGSFPKEMADYPVLVSYYEAESYSRWAGKRLPTEEEWEKAANGISELTMLTEEDGRNIFAVKKTKFPWGNSYENNCNDSFFWENSPIKSTELKTEKGPWAVNFFESKNISGYGAVNMAGNVAEWTSSWYDAYSGNKSYLNKRFGKQVKVVKGGSWFNNPDSVKNSSRGFAGLPSLKSDSSCGFRCVKSPSQIDIQ